MISSQFTEVSGGIHVKAPPWWRWSKQGNARFLVSPPECVVLGTMECSRDVISDVAAWSRALAMQVFLFVVGSLFCHSGSPVPLDACLRCLDVNLYWIGDGFRLQHALYGVFPVEDAATADHMQSILTQVLYHRKTRVEIFGTVVQPLALSDHTVKHLVTDGASNMSKLAKNLDLEWRHCAAHKVNLAVKATLENCCAIHVCPCVDAECVLFKLLRPFNHVHLSACTALI